MQTSTKPEQTQATKIHTIPLGALVELCQNTPEDEMHGVRLFVVAHLHDCDGTPLYAMSHNKKAYDEYQEARKAIREDEWRNSETPELAKALLRWKMHNSEGAIVFHYPVESLTVI